MEGIVYYLTKQGLEKMKKEYERLVDFRHQKTMGETPNILHSEEANPEYLAFQEDLSLLEAKIGELENILHNAQVIKPPKKEERHVVQLGAIVTLDFGGEIDEFALVGTMEADPAQKKISNESPIGKALMGAKAGATITPDSSVVQNKCKVLKIRYE